MAAAVPGNRPRQSLVRYDAPLELGPSSSQKTAQDARSARRAVDSQKKQVSQRSDSKPSAEQILLAILPPREWIEDNKHFLQYVTSQPASRLDVLQLQEALDQRLVERQARESGICPVREELYSQTFDELIRQVTINSPERGLLLLRIRDEIRLTIGAYQTLYETSVTFGTRKHLQAEQGKAETQQMIEDLEKQKSSLEEKVTELNSKCVAIEKRENERLQIERRKRHEEIEFLKHQGQHLESFLKSIDK
eukprot:GHVQ01016112.1.p1 GENE.GHVQ01016112.1~~GHVQ01016112.1.p1  ORF type:complete len:250 (+),score=34.86 GHVQ01016112.1:66-815(+)